MNSNSVMFILLSVFVLITLFAVAMCFKRKTPDPKNGTNEETEEEQLINYVKNMNRTYNRFYWGNNELD